MILPKLDARYLERLAFVYVRQSSPGQVRNHVESRERQLRMQEHVRQLGWPASQVRLLGGDTGRSGSSQHGRSDFQFLLEAVLDRTAGIIAASELSRLARDNQDWNHLIRLCRYNDVMLADGHRMYDPKDVQDRVVLGIQGAFNEYELAMLTDRMLQCRQQKAERGELYEGFPPGYICRKPPHQEKHPDDRVQRAIQKVFDDFDRQPSVYALFRQLQAEAFALPIVRSGDDWREIHWQMPSYDALLNLLKHPAYAGIYVRGRRKTVCELDAQGHLRRREQRVPRDEWKIFLPEHHEPYITVERWEENVKKITANAYVPGDATTRSPGKGASLLAGLLRCHECGHRLQVRYGKGVRYSCRAGAPQRGEGTACFSFAGSGLEQYVEELLLEAVRPSAVEAAERAAEQVAADRSRQRRVLQDRVEAAREAEARANREYKTTDETYLAVRQKLAAEWEEALQALHGAESRLQEFDATQPTKVSAAEREQLAQLSRNLERVWKDPRADGALKKQIVRTLITEITVRVDPESDEIQFWIHWTGGHHTEHRVPCVRRGTQATSDLCQIIGTLRKLLPDESLATTMNRSGLKTPSGQSWTRKRVEAFRRQHSIAAHSAAESKRAGWLTQADAATRLKISPMSVSRLISEGILPAEQPHPGLPAVILASDLELEAVRTAVHTLKTRDNRPLPEDPRQLSLFPTTKS